MKKNDRNKKNNAPVTALTQEEAKKRFLSMLGLARRAGKLVWGTQNVCDALKAGGASCVAEANDNSANTHKRLNDRCAYYGIKIIQADVSAEELGAAIGRRGPVSAAAVTDPSLAEGVRCAAERVFEAKKNAETEKM
ncbi:MAG: ribosomal L7Ae/L30e/S12e/Gadd45 family protein [Clostridia bacterium]|nr:ribosomal L7Ae/L30e/S12e/Gadd45 family protein [Clostridia bacterium]